MLSTQVTSLSKRQSRLRAQASNAIKYIKQELQFIAQEIVKEAQEYPPELPNQKYVRTYTLQGAWDIGLTEENEDGSLSVEISNDATDKYGEQYSSLVMGMPKDEFDEEDEDEEETEGQREIHQGRWTPLKEIQAAHAHEQANRIAGAIRRGLRS